MTRFVDNVGRDLGEVLDECSEGGSWEHGACFWIVSDHYVVSSFLVGNLVFDCLL